MESAGSSIRGNILIARLKFLEKRGGAGLVDKVLGRLAPADREVLRRSVLPVVWYSMELGARFDVAIAQELSPGDSTEIFKEMGRASAEANLTGAERVLLKSGDPLHLFKIAPSVYSLYYKVGHRSYEPLSPTSVVLKTFDADSVTANDCLTVQGWYERAIELSGGLHPRSTHPICRAKGSAHCEYIFEWSMPGNPPGQRRTPGRP